jgi:hypothetical protein
LNPGILGPFTSLTAHRIQKFLIILGPFHLILEKFHGVDGIQRLEEFAQNPYPVELMGGMKEFFLKKLLRCI